MATASTLLKPKYSLLPWRLSQVQVSPGTCWRTLLLAIARDSSRAEGKEFARVYLPNRVVELAKLEESILFPCRILSQSMKVRAARIDQKDNSHWAGETLARIVREMVDFVSYRSMCTLMVRVAPGGMDPTIRIKTEVRGKEMSLRFVLYAIRRKFIRYVPRTVGKWTTQFIGLWSEKDELVAGYWVHTKNMVVDQVDLIHAIASRKQIGNLGSVAERVATIDIDSPDIIQMKDKNSVFERAMMVPALQEYNRDKIDVSTKSRESVALDAVDLREEIAKIGIEGTAKDTPSEEETIEIEEEIWAPMFANGSTNLSPLSSKLKGAYDQRSWKSSILCSIELVISIAKDDLGLLEVFKRGK